VLSRITLGADVAITSVILDAVKRRFPGAAIWFAGPRKNFDLFAADSRIEHMPVDYGSTVEERFSPDQYEAVVVDPDSRISQLGLLPVAPEESYYFFESRGEGTGSLTEMARSWTDQVFGVAGAPYVAPAEQPVVQGAVAVSLGVGENPAKRLPDPFEKRLLAALPPPLVIDSGASEEEAGRVRRAAPAHATVLRGSFAQFAATIAASRLYVGYDSAGQHVAAAAGVPLVSVFAGYPSDRFAERWRPSGEVVLAGGGDELERVLAAVRRVLG
jgi:ADP-heptose:LPS heptosyltransferase